MKEIYIDNMSNNCNDVYMTNARTKILDCERLGKSLYIQTHTRRFIDKFRRIDTLNNPITLKPGFCLHGGLIYYKENEFSWKTISLDDCVSIYEV